MSIADVNLVVVTGNLTRDPELRQTAGGTSVCSMRVAVNGRRKDSTGEWGDKPNYFDVTVWGAQGENCATYLAKGKRVLVHGRLDWREWQTEQGGKRQATDIVAESVQFLSPKDSSSGGGSSSGGSTGSPAAAPAATGASRSSHDDDIPF